MKWSKLFVWNWLKFSVIALWGPFYWHILTEIPVWTSYYIHWKLWNEITYPFPHFNGWTVEVWAWISNFIPRFTGHVIIYVAVIILVKVDPTYYNRTIRYTVKAFFLLLSQLSPVKFIIDFRVTLMPLHGICVGECPTKKTTTKLQDSHTPSMPTHTHTHTGRTVTNRNTRIITETCCIDIILHSYALYAIV